MTFDPSAGDAVRQRIARVETWLAEIPTRRPHTLSFGTVTALHYVLVRVSAGDGAYGWGEAAVLGGPTWSEESAESIFETVDRYLAPLVIGCLPAQLETTRLEWDRLVRGNPFAKAAVEMAIMDLRARSLGVPLSELLGGRVRDSIPLSWSLGSSADADIAEATSMFAAGHRIFKIKVGRHSVQEDVDRVLALRRALGGEASIRVDANQGWNRREAVSALAPLAEAEPELLEQPVVREDIEGMALLQRQSPFPLMADECLFTVRDAIRIVEADAARVFALKVTKHAGLRPTMAVAAVAQAMGIGLYIGCMIESGIGTAAYAHLGAALPTLEYGCELFGPKMLAEDIVQSPIVYQAGSIDIPTGPGLGVEVDAVQLDRFTRPGYYRSAG